MLDRLRLFIISLLNGISNYNNTGNEIATNNKKVGEVATTTTSPGFKTGVMLKTIAFEFTIYIEIK